MTEYRKVEILEELDFEFEGTDLETYGFYEEGEVVELPKYTAEILVNRGVAEITGEGEAP